jgi:hypothetical protein
VLVSDGQERNADAWRRRAPLESTEGIGNGTDDDRLGMLVTYDCQIDKSSAERLHFLPLLPISHLDGSSRALVRRDTPKPYDILRLAVEDVEYYVRISHTMWLPLELFGEPEFVDVNPDEPPHRCLPSVNRPGTLADERLDLLRVKLLAVWAGVEPDDS